MMKRRPYNRTFWISVLITIIYRESNNNSFIPLFERKWIGQWKSLAIESSLLVTKPWPGFREHPWIGQVPSTHFQLSNSKRNINKSRTVFFSSNNELVLSWKMFEESLIRTCSIDQLINNERTIISRKNCWKESNHR